MIIETLNRTNWKYFLRIWSKTWQFFCYWPCSFPFCEVIFVFFVIQLFVTQQRNPEEGIPSIMPWVGSSDSSWVGLQGKSQLTGIPLFFAIVCWITSKLFVDYCSDYNDRKRIVRILRLFSYSWNLFVKLDEILQTCELFAIVEGCLGYFFYYLSNCFYVNWASYLQNLGFFEKITSSWNYLQIIQRLFSS